MRLLLISPVFNEAAHIDRVVRAVAAQTRCPDSWIVVDDGSTDLTLARLRYWESRIPFMRVIQAPSACPLAGARSARRRSCSTSVQRRTRAYNGPNWDYIGKLDGDVELEPTYYEILLARLRTDPALGIAAGDLLEERHGEQQRIPIPHHHVHGAIKLYSRTCFDEVGGIRVTLGWDTIDETYARLEGFKTRSFPDVTGFTIGRSPPLTGYYVVVLVTARAHGFAGTAFVWVALRAFKVGLARPFGLSGVAFLWGYLGPPQSEPPALRIPSSVSHVAEVKSGAVSSAL